MASEHRTSHEYGDIHVSESIKSFVPFTYSQNISDEMSQISSSKSLFDSAITKSSQSINLSFDQNDNQSLQSHSDLSNDSAKTVNNSHIKQKEHASLKNPNRKETASNTDTFNTPVLNTGLHNKTLNNISNSSDSESDSDLSDLDINSSHSFQNNINIMSPQLPSSSYMSEKDKFLMALNGSSQQGNTETSTDNQSLDQNPSLQIYSQKDLFDKSLQSQIQPSDERKLLSSKAMFDAFIINNNKGEMKSRNFDLSSVDLHQQQFVKANVVADQLHSDYDENILADYDFETLADFDAMDFDIDKYLDMSGDLEEFLEKGWRPTESPQIPQSSYPVLGKISSNEVKTFSNGNNQLNKNGNNFHLPPTQPPQAWKDSPVSELKGIPPRPSPIPIPSPAPSSVASAAETLGGHSLRSKKDELTEEWGFKDSRTAELMMARAKKMKYNADRKRKLNKLDPQQRFQLFRRLEESGKIRHIKPPPAKVLPRKEYFQAREDEVQRQELEKRIEENTKVNRTFEWIHTQVGDYPISTSRINPSPGSHTQQHRKISSPSSQRSHRSGSQSSILPPIQPSSASSSQYKERISRRDNPVEKSMGWGGGKKRGKIDW